MRSLSHALLILPAAALLGAGTLRAQTPGSSTPPGPAARSLWFDAGALINDQIRAGAEAIPLGRFTAGLSISYSHTPHRRDVVAYPVPYAVDGSALPQCDPRMLMSCAYPDYYYPYGDATRYRAWAFDLAVRYYPAAFSFRNGAARMNVYAGAYAGYHWRTWDENVVYYYAYPALETTDSTIPLPGYPIRRGPNPIRHTLKGVEPGVEVGVRLLPIGPLFLEVGGRFTLAVVDDPMQRVRPGDVAARLVLAGGIAW